MDKLGKLLRFVMQINSCIDCYFETQPFHPHLSYNPKSGWVGLFQPHVDMSKLKDLSVISRTNFYIFASCKVTLETFWKQNGNFLPIQPRHFQWPHLFSGADLLQLTPFFVSWLFLGNGLTVGAPFWHTGWLELRLVGHINLNSGSWRSSCVCLFLNKLYPTTQITLMVACNSYHFAKWLFRFFFHLFSFSSVASPLFYRMQSCISSDNGGPGNCQSLAPWRPRSLKCS